MYKNIICLIVVILFYPMNTMDSEEIGNGDSWLDHNESSMDLEVTSVGIHLAADFSSLKKTRRNTLGGPGSGPGSSNFCMDAYTAPSWASNAPSVFTVEQYSFSGGSEAVVTHRVVVTSNAGPWPTPLSLAFAWQPCGNGVIYPPIPVFYNGWKASGPPLELSLPYTGIWYITVTFVGWFSGTYDWGWLARYDHLYPIPVPPAPATDLGGMEGQPSWRLHNVMDKVGDGRGSGRPWCFRVLP